MRGMGHVYQRGAIWWIKYSVAGEPRFESSESTVKQDAVDLLKRRLGLPTTRRSAQVTVDELVKDVLAFYETHRPKSYKTFAVPVVAHLDWFRGMKAAKVSTGLINEYIKDRQKENPENATINRELALLRRAFKLASRATPPKVTTVPHFELLPETAPRKGFLEREQYEKMLAALPEELKGPFVIGYHTGLRKSKVLGLRVEQVDMERKAIRLNPEKNARKNTPDVVPVYGDMGEFLKKAIDGRAAGLLFHRDGTPIVNLRPAWGIAAEAAAVPRLLFHDLRRSAVRNMIRAGVPEKIAMSISGHKTRSVFDRYNIVNEKDISDAGALMEGFGKKKKGAGA